MNVFPADRQNTPWRGPMPFEFIQPASMAANNNRMRDAVTWERSRVPACLHLLSQSGRLLRRTFRQLLNESVEKIRDTDYLNIVYFIHFLNKLGLCHHLLCLVPQERRAGL